MDRYRRWKSAAVGAAAVLIGSLGASLVRADPIQTVFVIARENHNWTQSASQTSPGQILGNSAAPYINSLVTPGNPNAAQVSYASNYQNAAAGVHPSEPNYIWAEGGSNFGVTNDNDPYTGGTNQTTTQSLSNYLQNKGVSWRSYQENIDINTANHKVLPSSQYTVPLTKKSGTFTSGTNQYNGSNHLTMRRSIIRSYFSALRMGERQHDRQSAGEELRTAAAADQRLGVEHSGGLQLDNARPT